MQPLKAADTFTRGNASERYRRSVVKLAEQGENAMNDIGSPGDTSGAGTTGSNKSSSTRLVINLVVLLVLGMGFYSWRSDNQLVRYHNDFFKQSYNSIFVEIWNKFILDAKAGDMNDQQAAEFLKTRMLPALKEWEKRADETIAPTDAQEFHIRFTSELHDASKKTQLVIKSIENGETEIGSESLKQLVQLVDKIGNDASNFQTQLKNDRNFEFEKAK